MAQEAKTQDYEIFKHYNCNRKIDKKLVKKIVLSIKKNNLLEFRPILVNEKYEVIDGQHRLEAARILGVPIYYTINNQATDQDLILLNNVQKPWTLDDYLNYWCSKGKREYLLFRDTVKRYGLSVSRTLMFYTGSRSEKSREFKSGELKAVPMAMIDETLHTIKDIKAYLAEKLVAPSRSFLEREHFMRALIMFLKHPEINKELLFKKLEVKMSLLRVCTNATEYVKILQDIYNYRNQEPIEII